MNIMQGIMVANRDTELGRWRSPTDPDFVVYRHGRDDIVDDPYYRECLVVDERDGSHHRFGSDISSCYGGEKKEIAREYFDAHPYVEPTPWSLAKDGEIWELWDKIEDTGGTYIASKSRFFRLPLVKSFDQGWLPGALHHEFDYGKLLYSGELEAEA
jgi:hypothetical protein